jgi:hypothetical protein
MFRPKFGQSHFKLSLPSTRISRAYFAKQSQTNEIATPQEGHLRLAMTNDILYCPIFCPKARLSIDDQSINFYNEDDSIGGAVMSFKNLLYQTLA